jgi:aryl-alcohol dehydrogenase-like predicted oxidoreductase
LPPSAAERLILGTAQFGMPYGVTNRHGQVSAYEVNAILIHARDAGVTMIDTAAGYGTSEETLGFCLPDLPSLKVITKIPSVISETVAATDTQRIRDSISRSLDRLRRDKVHGLLTHHGADLLKPGGERIVELLESLKQEGTTACLGVSVYDADEIDRILKMMRPDIVQLPVNLFDQRLVQSGHIAMLREAGIEIHGRSTFLQGILLTKASELPEYFRHFVGQFALYERFIDEHKLPRLVACLGFMIEQSGVDRVIVGVTTRKELAEILAVLRRQFALPPMNKLACSDASLVDPRRWVFSAQASAATRL